MQMRPSRVLRKLRAGETVCCVKLNLADAHVAEIAALCGVDCIWLDREHTPVDLLEVEHQVWAARAHDVDVVVRVPRGSYSDLIHPLEMDASGVMVPHVMNGEDARRVAWFTRFHPIGRRPVDGGNADGAYCMIPTLEYMQQANQERFVIVQIEDPEALEEVEQIAQVEGIDMLFFGPGDFSHGIGDPGNYANPRVIEARRVVAETARRYGKFAGTVAGFDTLAATVDLGYQFVNVGADVLALTQYFKQAVAAFAGLGRKD